MFRQNGNPPVHEFNVYPINQQRSPAQQNERTESPLSRTPAAPGITRRQNNEKHANTNQKKIRTGVPVVVNGVKLPGLRLQPTADANKNHTGRAENQKYPTFVLPRPRALQNK